MGRVLLSSLLVVFIILLSSLIVNAKYTQLQITNVTFIPKTVSAKSGVIVVAGIEGEGPIRVSWYSPTYFGEGYNVIGNLFKIDEEKYICYFSDTDKDSMCGPSPFIEPNMGDYIGNPPTEFIVWAQSTLKEEQNEKTSKTEQVYVGSIKLNPVLSVEGGKLYILVYPNNIVNSVKYEIYDKKINKLAEGKLEWDSVKGGYTKAIHYNDNYYYIAFSAFSSNDVGGNVVRIPRETKNQSKTNVNLIIDNVVIHDAVVRKNMPTTFHRLFKITNLGETLKNLHVDVPSALSSYLKIELENTTLKSNDTTYMDITIKNIAADTDIRTTANLMSGNKKIGEIKVNIEVSVIKGEIPTTLPKITPAIWSDEYELGTVDKEFVISNNAEQDIYGINYSVSGEIKNIITIKTPKELAAHSIEKIKMILNPRSAGTKTGVVSINTNAGSIEIPISITFYEKISDKVSAAVRSFQQMKSKMTDEQKTKLSPVLEDIEDNIQSAKAYSSKGNYKEGLKEIEKAEAKIDILGKIIASGFSTSVVNTGQPNNYGMPNTANESSNIGLIIIVSIIGIGIAVGVWYYFTKIRKSENEWEEVEEEF